MRGKYFLTFSLSNGTLKFPHNILHLHYRHCYLKLYKKHINHIFILFSIILIGLLENFLFDICVASP